MPLQATSGAASYDAFGGGVPVVPNYIEDVFSTYLYTGNATTGQSINNGIDLATKGGLLWCKNRTTGSTPHYLFDTARDFSYSNAAVLNTASTAAQEDKGTDYAKPETNGFSFGSGAGSTSPNKSGDAFASWTFRKQPKFFDIVTYTGNGSSKTINHNLGSVPGVMIVKSTTYVDNWAVYHRSLGATKYIELNNTDAASTSVGSRWDAEPTSTSFSVGYNGSVNASGQTYVAYLFAHNAGGFGLTGTDNVISCGSFTADGSGNASVTLGYEPQWVMVKASSTTGGWYMFDTMREMSQTNSRWLVANTSAAEATGGGTPYLIPTATGFTANNSFFSASSTNIYIAIRRGPMKVPTSGTSVFNAVLRTGTGATATVTGAGFVPDLVIPKARSNSATATPYDRLRGPLAFLQTSATNAESSAFTDTLTAFGMNGFTVGADASFGSINQNPYTYVNWMFKRAPSFFDEVCWTGDSSGTFRTISHGLSVAPELIIYKRRDAASDWNVYHSSLGNNAFTQLNTTGGIVSPADIWNYTTPTSTSFTVGYANTSPRTYVSYLFATCAGVSKCTSFTGTGTLQTIDCGFTAGSRFVLIKRTDSTGDWYVWDSSRGLSSSTDPYLLLNSTAAEVTSTNWVDTTSTGFQVTAASGNNVNINGASYIALAIA